MYQIRLECSWLSTSLLLSISILKLIPCILSSQIFYCYFKIKIVIPGVITLFDRYFLWTIWLNYLVRFWFVQIKCLFFELIQLSFKLVQILGHVNMTLWNLMTVHHLFKKCYNNLLNNSKIITQKFRTIMIDYLNFLI